MLQTLILLQEVDLKLDEIEREKGDLPVRVQELASRLERTRQELVSTEADLERLQVEKRSTEGNIKTLEVAKKKYEEQLYAVTTNREYDAVTLEIETAAEKIDTEETHLLELIDQEEQARAKKAELEESLSSLESAHKVQAEELKRKIAANAEVASKLQEDRKRILVDSKTNFVRLYERIRGVKSGLAVVPVIRGSCSGCYTQIPPQRSLELRDADKIIACESCGRILYWPEETETAEVA